MNQILDEVVCIDDSAQDANGDSVVKGTIYRVREVKQRNGKFMFKLHGLTAGIEDGGERFFRGDRFRILAPDLEAPAMAAGGAATDPAAARVIEALSQLPIASPPAGFLPIYLPAAGVLKLRRLADAAEIEGGADGFADLILGTSVADAAASTPQILAGAADVIFSSYVFPDEVRPQIKSRLAAAAANK